MPAPIYAKKLNMSNKTMAEISTAFDGIANYVSTVNAGTSQIKIAYLLDRDTNKPNYSMFFNVILESGNGTVGPIQKFVDVGGKTATSITNVFESTIIDYGLTIGDDINAWLVTKLSTNTSPLSQDLVSIIFPDPVSDLPKVALFLVYNYVDTWA